MSDDVKSVEEQLDDLKVLVLETDEALEDFEGDSITQKALAVVNEYEKLKSELEGDDTKENPGKRKLAEEAEKSKDMLGNMYGKTRPLPHRIKSLMEEMDSRQLNLLLKDDLKNIIQGVLGDKGNKSLAELQDRADKLHESNLRLLKEKARLESDLKKAREAQVSPAGDSEEVNKLQAQVTGLEKKLETKGKEIEELRKQNEELEILVNEFREVLN